MEKPLISVIMPVYNVEKYIEKCVESVINQTYKNLEIILIDDGSPDKCPEICDLYAEKDSRIKVIHKENGGLASARNSGLDIATGDYIAFVDSDDWIDTTAYEEMLNAAFKTKADIVCCEGVHTDGVQMFEECLHCKPDGTVLNSSDVVKEILLDNIGSQVVKGLYKNYCWEGIRFPIGRLYEDIPVTFKAFVRTEKVAYINKPFYKYRINKDSITHRLNPLVAYDIYLGFKEHYDFAVKAFPEISDVCCVKAAHYAISTYFNYYSVGKSNKTVDLNAINDFLIKNKAVIKKHKSKIPYTRGMALTVYYLSPWVLKIFCKIFGSALIKLRNKVFKK